MFSEYSALGIVHKILKMHIKPGDFCIDATSGNGHDSVYLCELCGESGHVLAMDIQPEAVESTKTNLAEHGFSEMSEVFCTSHSEIDKFAKPNTADCIVFNFGWLPGGSHDVFTRAETSSPAIQKSLDILKPGGLLSLCVYYGRNNGYSERDAILEFVKSLPGAQYNVMKCDFLNRPNDPPFPIFIVKDKEYFK